MLDDIDLELLKYCSENPCQPLAAAVKSLLGQRAERTLYDRLKLLENQKLIAVDRAQKNVALARITHQGMDAITGREKPTSREARSP